jgi:hypothetical protein
MNKLVTLLVFEGERTEPRIFDNLKRTLFSNTENRILYATYNTNIYQLWNEIKQDDGLDLIEILRERNLESLNGIIRKSVFDIYLFFDHDPHDPFASDDEIEKMLEYFDNETANGKLYISYPMVEALKHFENDLSNERFKDCIESISTLSNYKRKIGKFTCFQDIRHLTKENWNYIILENIKKANHIVNSVYIKPEYSNINEFNQKNIFSNQLENYIRPYKSVAVLSGVPFFIVEYFGEGFYNNI